ncbi:MULTISPECIES: hypothetical protein [Sphingobium]|uniref:hypothetical protein n=1 Tax=Sphingobium TaxID=165695 RepID=UPI00159C2F17|nr:hypothetical protein [Sphingobium sp. 15-1]
MRIIADAHGTAHDYRVGVSDTAEVNATVDRSISLRGRLFFFSATPRSSISARAAPEISDVLRAPSSCTTKCSGTERNYDRTVAPAALLDLEIAYSMLRVAFDAVVIRSLSWHLSVVRPFGTEVLGWTAPNGIAMCQGDVVVGLT